MYWKPLARQKLTILATLTMIALGTSRQALGCASCGSGGGDPLILYPTDDLKVYSSLGIQKITREVSIQGKRGEVFGPTEKFIATLAGGVRLTDQSFATLTSGYQFNSRGAHSGKGLVDPSLMARYSLIVQAFDQPWVPQLQVLLGYKKAIGTSIHTSKTKDLVDITSSGFNDLKVGVDLWYGMFDVKGGVALLAFFPEARRESDGTKNQSGDTLRLTVTGAYQLSDAIKVTSGLSRQATGARSYNGATVPDSKTLDHSGFANLDFTGYEAQSVRLSLVKTALLGGDRLTTESHSLTMAFLSNF